MNFNNLIHFRELFYNQDSTFIYHSQPKTLKENKVYSYVNRQKDRFF